MDDAAFEGILLWLTDFLASTWATDFLWGNAGSGGLLRGVGGEVFAPKGTEFLGRWKGYLWLFVREEKKDLL